MMLDLRIKKAPSGLFMRYASTDASVPVIRQSLLMQIPS